MTLDIPESRPSEKKEDETAASSVDPESDVAGDYPDGGLAAWCVVLGVSPISHFACSFQPFC